MKNLLLSPYCISMAIFLTLIGLFYLQRKIIIICKINNCKKYFFNFTDKLTLSNKTILLIDSLSLNGKNGLPFPYLPIKCVDEDFKEIETKIDGIGSEFHSDFKLIRVIKKDKGNWCVGFMEKTTGKLVIKFKYHKAIPYLTNDHYCEILGKKVIPITYSRVHRLGSTTPEYINENGKKIKNFYPELYIRNNIKAPQI